MNLYEQSIIQRLIDSKDIRSFAVTKEYEIPGVESRTTEKLSITFPSGNTLTIVGFSSGSAQNTVLQISR